MVEVEFPDGTVQQVPSRPRTVKGRRVGREAAPTVTFEEPIYHPAWVYRPLGGGRWFADHRGPCR